MTTLYARDNRGQTRVWTIVPHYDLELLEITHGLLYGAKQTKAERVIVNQSGRSLIEQMQLQMASRINKQLDKGYTYSPEETHAPRTNRAGYPRPMLAQAFGAESLSGDHYVQRKYNGARCIVTKQNDEMYAYTRNGKPIESIEHVLDRLRPEMENGEYMDGELYRHGTPLQKLLSLIKRKQPESDQLVYVMYDVMQPVSFPARLDRLHEIGTSPWIEVAPTYKTSSIDTVYELFSQFREEGYEGAIVRDANTPYEDGKRSKSLRKLKAWMDSEFLVTDIQPSKDGWAVLTCLMPSGQSFNVAAPGTMQERELVLIRKGDYIGKKLNVEFANYTEAGLPFHPIAKYWRS